MGKITWHLQLKKKNIYLPHNFMVPEVVHHKQVSPNSKLLAEKPHRGMLLT